MPTVYTTTGPVRGSCGHRHRTPKAARACLDADVRDCKRAGGYSDRVLRAIEGGVLRALTQDEHDAARGGAS